MQGDAALALRLCCDTRGFLSALERVENAFEKLVKLITKKTKDELLEIVAWVVGWLMQYDKKLFKMTVTKAVDLGKILMDLW